MPPPTPADLVVLTADSQIKRTIETLLAHRQRSLGISALTFDVMRHHNSDPGCRADSDAFLDPIRGDYRKALVVFDFDGCGENRLSAPELEIELERQLENAGWEPDGAAVVIIEPELEAWLFGASYQQLQQAVRWSQPEPIREWLASNGHLPSGAVKTTDPKATIGAVFHNQRIHPSAKLYADLARVVGLARCRDRAFQKFRETMQRWFPAG